MFVVISGKTGTLSGYSIFRDRTNPLDIYNEYIIDLQEVKVSLELTADIQVHIERLFYGGSSVRETVARIMIELFSNDLAIQYNMNGQKGKMSFGKLHLANLHNHRSQMSISRNKHISPVTAPYLQHAFPYAHTRFSHTCRHIPLHYSLALISLRSTPTHQKHTHTRHQSPTIDTQTQPPLRTATKQDSQQTLHQSNPNHARHRNQPRTTEPQVSVWHMPQGSYIQPVRCCVRHLQHLASNHLHAHVISRLRIAPQHLMALYIMNIY